MRPLHLALKQFLGFVLVFGCTISPSARNCKISPVRAVSCHRVEPALDLCLRAHPSFICRILVRPVSREAGDQQAPKRKADLAHLKTESDELQKLAAGLPDKFAKMQDGILPADLITSLERIEKLSKHIRAELQ